ncbi:MAG: YidC/Oxa1 family membrane protein insertase [Dehalococcoidales bacterium]|nr:YidC/Oxa1 family membrane protein insertase [Dehalococcoidales bacterium]
MDIGAIWELIILNPMINVLIVVSKYLFNSPGIAIIIFTVLIRGVMYPLSKKQLESSKKMQDLQPRIQELQKKYGKDKQRMAKEQAALLKETGVTNIGCILPMLIQTPIWIALYQSIIRVLATTPEALLNLSRHLYSSWGLVFPMVPLNSQFLWLDLGSPDKLMILPILVGGTMWLQQKMVTPQTTDAQQQSQSQMMLVMMPLLFAFMTLNFPSGLALYWVTSNVISIVMQYFVTGWGGLAGLFGKKPDDTNKPSKPYSEPKKIQSREIDSTARNVLTGPQNTEKGKPIWKFWK